MNRQSLFNSHYTIFHLGLNFISFYKVAQLGLTDDGEGIILRKFSHGQSNPTYYLKFGGKEMVLRKKPVSLFNVIHCMMLKRFLILNQHRRIIISRPDDLLYQMTLVKEIFFSFFN